MKANEVLEKIYLFENPISGAPDDRWLSKRSDDNDIEYTRTDAFIEKTKKWFEEHFGNSIEWEIATYEFKDMKSMIENFKRYLEE